MAGIGFELKKLYKNSGIIFNLKAVLYSSIVTIGPQLLCIFMITFLQIILQLLNIGYGDREVFLASTVYAFIFSQLITSGFSMIITRYISDKLYLKEYDKIKSSLYGAIVICVTIGATFAIIFFYKSKLNPWIKLSTYILYIELIIMWLENVYLSALKDYMKIVKGFLIGSVSAVVLGWILLASASLNPSLALLIALDVGIFIISAILMFYIQGFFKTNDKKYFDFIKYFDKYYFLFFISFFYTLSLYVHNFIYWFSDLSRVVAGTYVYAPSYDVPTFYALLTILPASIIFVISVETAFYDRYKEYYSLITNKGNLNDIIRAKKGMLTVLWSEIFKLMEVQLFFTFIFILAGDYFLPYIGLTVASIDIFNILSIGAYCNVIMLIFILIELYFEDRKGACITASTFLITNILFTTLSITLGQSYYGLGYFTSSFISLVVALITLIKFLSNIDYITFCSQPVIYREKIGVFSRIITKMYGEN